MSLGSALSIAMSGLTANQAGLSIISSNIANANTPGYVSQNLNTVEQSVGSGTAVQVAGITRTLDTYVQNQLRSETAGGGYADQISSVLTQLQNVYGTPGGTGSLETSFTNLTSAVQGLSASSGAYSAQTAVVTAAQDFADQLNTTSQGIQSLRSEAQQDIASSVQTANTDLAQIANLNSQLQGMSTADSGAATLEDQRDTVINQLAKLMSISTSTDASNQVSVYTTSGTQLVGAQASTLTFTGPGTLTANNLYSSTPSQNGVGSIILTSPSGATTDLSATGAISSGQIAADVQLRDNTLVQAQTQVDQLAASVSSALSDTTTSGTAVTTPSAGYSLDLTNMQAGNTVNLTYTDSSNVQHQVSIVGVTDSSVLPLANTSTNPNNTVIGVNISGSASNIAASIATQLSAAFPGLSVSGSGNTLQIVSNTSSSPSTVNSASATITTSSLASGSPSIPLFTDGSTLYTGAVTSAGSQMTGYAGRIEVNPAVVTTPSSLTVYSTSPATLSGDTTRADYITAQLTTATSTFSPATGLGSKTTPLTSTISDYMEQFLNLQATSATNAQQLQQGQDVVVNTLQQSYDSTTGVNMDAQMSNLISLQNAYSANAHVMAVVQSMFQTLLQAQT